MMGERVVARALFHGFSVERHVPADHLLQRQRNGYAPTAILKSDPARDLAILP